MLGAMGYLLRSCHEYIHRREFDRRRVPEYYNQMLLGALSGGAILLYTQNAQVGIGPSAIAFLAGYNTDFLFTVLERVADAILPKIVRGASEPRTSTAVAAAAPISPVTTPSSPTSAADERVARIQRFLQEMNRPQYASGGTDGVWDERTRIAVAAFLGANYSSVLRSPLATPPADFQRLDKETLIAEMSPFVWPEIRVDETRPRRWHR